MSWLVWVAVPAALIAVFVAWDFLVCGGEYCRRIRERRNPPPPGSALPHA